MDVLHISPSFYSNELSKKRITNYSYLALYMKYFRILFFQGGDPLPNLGMAPLTSGTFTHSTEKIGRITISEKYIYEKYIYIYTVQNSPIR